MKNTVTLSLLFVLVSAYAAPLMSQQAQRVGVIVPLSGEFSYIGEACKNGIAMANAKQTEDEASQVEFVFEDDRLDSKASVSAFRKLHDQQKLFGVINLSSHTGKALGPIVDREGVPFIAIASDRGVVEGRSHVVSLWVTPEVQIKLLMEKLKESNIKKIARISALHNATEAFRAEFDKRKGEDVQVVLEDEYLVDSKDFKPFILKLKQLEGVDAVFVNLFFGQVGTFAKQARELGVNLPLFGIEAFEDEKEVKNSGGALIGQWYIQGDDGSDMFVENYRESYPESPIYSAVNCHDAALLFMEAAQKGLDSTATMAFLKNAKDFEGASGVFSATGDNRFTLPAVVKVVKADGFEEIS